MANTIQDVYIISSARTPIGNFNGKLASKTSVELGTVAIKAAIERAGISTSEVEEVFFGNVYTANSGQNPARQVALKSGISESAPCTTLNKVCASGLKAVSLASQAIQLGQADVIVAGGMESMSNVPYYLPNVRGNGLKYGDATLVDGLPRDGLHDAYENCPMGNFAELCSKEHSLTRTNADDYAVRSYTLARSAHDNGSFKEEIVPVSIAKPGRGQSEEIINVDESCQRFDEAKMRSVKPAFPSAGDTVTGPNASSLSDGAAALVVVSGKWLEHAKASGKIKPDTQIFQVLGYADAATTPNKFTTAPALAIPKALERANVNIDQVDYFEINEAFSAVALANVKLLDLDVNKVNVYGGAVAIGHPLGASGARILVTLTSVLKAKKGSIGVAGICNGGGGATALVIKRLD